MSRKPCKLKLDFMQWARTLIQSLPLFSPTRWLFIFLAWSMQHFVWLCIHRAEYKMFVISPVVIYVVSPVAICMVSPVAICMVSPIAICVVSPIVICVASPAVVYVVSLVVICVVSLLVICVVSLWSSVWSPWCSFVW